ncbi:MAG: carboxypeptidase regulatory-like domain-containing protein [Flavobacteriales bacterium]
MAQNLVQVVRGKVVDTESKSPILGAVVMVYKDSTLVEGAETDEFGLYQINDVPVGHIRIVAMSIGYKHVVMDNVMLGSAKELLMDIEMEQQVDEALAVEITATREGDVQNEMATVSARQFSVNETDRYAGSRGDPARMASNFAGVQGADDSRNDIVIRGNSPQGVLWRMEGIDIPNPNHFNIPGTAGGPVSIINNKYLANSDFYTGAFPADYGNSVAGVFDLRMRNGNNQKHEFSGQFGFLGTELFAEGPLFPLHRRGAGGEAKGSSYLASYRYSTIELFSKLGIDIGTDAVPRYQDAAFRLFFPGRKNSSLAVWGVGGKSSIDILISDQKTPDQRNIYGDNDRDQYFKTHMGVLGVTYHKTISEKTFFKTTIAAMTDQVDSSHELVSRHLDENNRYVVDSLTPLLEYTFTQSRISIGSSINNKINRHWTWRSGFNADYYFWNHVDSLRELDTASANYYGWNTRWNSVNSGYLIQPYTQFKWRPSDTFTLTVGLHGTVFQILPNGDNKRYASVNLGDWRLGLRRELPKQQSISLGVGRHSQIQPTYMYFFIGDYASSANVLFQKNYKMHPTVSHHFVMSYQRVFNGKLRLLAEAYLQDLSEIPVDYLPSSFSMVNSGSGFQRVFPSMLVNEGEAFNRGIELTIEKFFSRNWLFLFTTSIFESKYRGSDGVWRNTDFNGKYAVNALVSKEWKLNENARITTGTKLTTAGGRWYGPADIEASNAARELVFVDSLRNTKQFAPYFRWDIKLNYTVNRKKVAHHIGLDLVNVLNTKNVLKLTYAPDENNDPNTAVRQEYQLGFLPVFFYKIDF